MERYAKQSILVFIVFFLFLGHFFACPWLLVGRIERDSDSPNWIDFNLEPLHDDAMTMS